MLFFAFLLRPIINNKFEDKTCGDGPSLTTMFDDDRHLQTLVNNIRESMNAAFNAATVYRDTYEEYREFYRENESADLEAIRNKDHGTFACIIIRLSKSRFF